MNLTDGLNSLPHYDGGGDMVMDNTCIFCGEVVPEGWILCPNCEAELWPK